ncbi:MAG: hypothetical protein J0I06_11205 [Planctomycetes bacterium]|nr:hypothetical protein [Planctomycetota bacterium]
MTITNLSDDDTNDMPFTLDVSYEADRDGLEVAIFYSGSAVTPQNAPQSSGSPTFQLDWAGLVTNETVTAVLRVKADPSNVLDTSAKTGLTFIGPP